MSIETYRYLFSALIQVFGTIIAVNAIFLILKHEFDLKRLRTLKGMVANDIIVWEIRGLTRADYSRAPGWRAEAEDIEYYVVIPDDDFQQRTDNMIQRIKSKIETYESEANNPGLDPAGQVEAKRDATNLAENLEVIQNRYNAFLDLKSKTDNYFRAVIRVMRIPAAFSVIFSIGLLFTEQVHCMGGLLSVAIIAIILSVVGFTQIIRQAAKTFIEIKST